MPPKGSKSKNRAHPYGETPRQSTRQKDLAARREEARDEMSVMEPVGNNDEQVTIPIVSQPQPSTSHGTNNTNIHNNQDEPRPSTSQQEPQLTIPQMQVVSSVSRDEFNRLQESMSSIKNMFSTFMSSFSNNQGSQSSGPGGPSASAGSPFPLPEVNINSPNNTVVSQPIARNPDINIPVPSASNADEEAARVLSQAINSHVRTISGDQATGKTRGDKVSYQLDRKIPQKVMQDIWDDKYVDLELLLDKKEDPQAPMVFKAVDVTDLGQIIQVVKPKPPKGITNIDQWAKAFDIYISVYTRKFYYETHNLLTYSNKVKELAAKSGDFLRYDEEFRQSRTRYGTPWESPDLELWVECKQAGLQDQIVTVINHLSKSGQISLNNSSNSSFQSSTDSEFTKVRHPSGACYTFHNSGRCGRSNCKFSHLCYNTGCGEQHSVYKCPKGAPGQSQPSPYPGPKSNNPTTTNSSTTPSHSNKNR